MTLEYRSSRIHSTSWAGYCAASLTSPAASRLTSDAQSAIVSESPLASSSSSRLSGPVLGSSSFQKVGGLGGRRNLHFEGPAGNLKACNIDSEESPGHVPVAQDRAGFSGSVGHSHTGRGLAIPVPGLSKLRPIPRGPGRARLRVPFRRRTAGPGPGPSRRAGGRPYRESGIPPRGGPGPGPIPAKSGTGNRGKGDTSGRDPE
jgi:hypothetical protein